MPVLDGLETTRLMRANPAWAAIPVIAMTASASGEDRERCLAAGMNGFIGKPFKPHAFYAAIANCLSAHARQAPVSGIPAAPAANWAGDPEIIDFSVLSGLLGGKKLKMHEFALKFLASARQDMAKIEAALERQDLAALGVLGHHIKSPAGMVGALGFAGLCHALEDIGKTEGSAEQARDILCRMYALLDRIREETDKHLA